MTFAWRRGGLSIEGSSRAGDRSWFRVHPPGVAFDVGRGAAELAGVRDVFLTHGHLDHALGLPYVLSQRGVHGGEAMRVFCPREIMADVEALVAAAARLERAEYRYELHGLGAGDRVAVDREHCVEAFAVDHVVPALGYHLIQRRLRLRSDLAGLDGSEIAVRRRAGEAVEEPWEEIRLAYCGDTTAAAFELEPRLFTARVLLLECTFLDPAKRSDAQRYKHFHVEDLPALADRMRNETILLTHLSRRHGPEELRAYVDRHVPRIASRVEVLADDRT
jgi:ribonuclease Z